MKIIQLTIGELFQSWTLCFRVEEVDDGGLNDQPDLRQSASGLPNQGRELTQ